MIRAVVAAILALTACTPAFAAAEPLVVTRTAAGFPIVAEHVAAPIYVDAADFPVVTRAAHELADDIAAVSGARPALATATPILPVARAIIIGTIGRSALIDGLVRAHRLDASQLRGAWESYVIATVRNPLPGIASALVIVGSDRRGTAYGVYELSQAIGVSPWHWWADVPPLHQETLVVPEGTRRFGPPSVRYRGIFLNDEDWGLYPWAARTLDPQRGNIGPKTYERVFQLLLRLKANTLWPAMHKVSAPFNADPANARLADDYAIVMGSSHAEPMLRDNVGEWKDTPEAFDYATNPTGVRAYWEERVRANAPYENLWTLGMRGIHDSGMVGGADLPGKVDLLTRVIADQRAMLRRHVSPDLSGAKQMFMPYKEVLDLYRNGLKVPDDVTIVWPDDNFGYIRQFPTDTERARSGGMGVYYHLSYLGAPLSYLWLGTTPPALVQEEMTRAWDAGARSVWIANVGDIKPGEIALSYFLEMAWDIDRWRHVDQQTFLTDWAARTFGAAEASAIGKILDAHFRVNFERRPEHLQWWLPGEKPHREPGDPFEVDGRLKLSPADIDARLGRFDALVKQVDQVSGRMTPAQSDAFFELVAYPVKAAAAANRRFFGAERYDTLVDSRPDIARAAGAAAVAADQKIKALTRRYNEDVAGGKWRHILAEEPADDQWRDYRTVPVMLPAPGLVGTGTGTGTGTTVPRSPDDRESPRQTYEAENFTSNHGWHLLAGLGRGAGAMRADAPGARLTMRVTVPAGGDRSLALGLLPLFADSGASDTLKVSVSIDGAAAETIAVAHPAGSPIWVQGVLDNLLTVPVAGLLSPGAHSIGVTAGSTGIALDQLMVLRPLGKTGH